MPVIKLRGLPWSCTPDDIVKFLHGIKIMSVPNDDLNSSNNGGPPEDVKNFKPAIYLTANAEGRPSGEAFIELEDENDLEMALKRNNVLMGQRYIEVFRSNKEQLNKHIQESMNHTTNWSDPVVRLRGLPYGCTKPDISQFFNGLNIAYDGIMMVIDFTGRFNGEAFVQFDNILDAHRALDRHKQKISNRYIEVFRSTFDEMTYYSSNSNMIRLNKNGNAPVNHNSIRNGNFNGNGIPRRNSSGGRRSPPFSSSSSYSPSNNSSRSNSVNGFTNGSANSFRSNNRAKPYSRNNPANGNNLVNQKRRRRSRSPLGFHDHMGNGGMHHPSPVPPPPPPLSQSLPPSLAPPPLMANDNKSTQYVCENNHRHYLNFNSGNRPHTPPSPPPPPPPPPPHHPFSFKQEEFGINNHHNGRYPPNNHHCSNNGNQNGRKNFDFNQQFNMNYHIERTGYGVRMRGLPYTVTESEIRQFFHPLKPINVFLLNGRDQRPSGECECDFLSHNDACEAMKYDKKFIGNRYIELFLLSGSMATNPNPHATAPGPNPGKGNTSLPISFGSLMSKDFGNSGNPSPNNGNGYGYRSRNGGGGHISPVPPPPPPPIPPPSSSIYDSYESKNHLPPPPSHPPNMSNQPGPLMPPMPIPPPPPPPNMPPQSGPSSSAYQTNINEMFMADMAKTMLATYTQFQQQQQQYFHQQQQQKFNGSLNNYNGIPNPNNSSNNRRY